MATSTEGSKRCIWQDYHFCLMQALEAGRFRKRR